VSWSRKKPFGLTPAAHEHSIESIRRAWQIVTALAVAVDVEPRLPLQFGKHVSIDAQARRRPGGGRSTDRDDESTIAT